MEETKLWRVSEQIRDFVLTHTDSGRKVPVREYSAAGQPRGWVLYSVGFGGQVSGYSFLGRRWSSMGLSTFVVEHVGSNLEVLKSLGSGSREERNARVVRRVQDQKELRARPRDLQLVHRVLSERFSGLPLGLGGHSYGSFTVLAASGLSAGTLEETALCLKADALLLISPQPPGMLFAPAEYRKVEAPCLLLTGTEDHLLDGSASYTERLEVFRFLPEEYRYLAVLRGTEHMAFAGLGLKIAEHVKATRDLTAAWWERTLLGVSSEAPWPRQAVAAVGEERIEQCR